MISQFNEMFITWGQVTLVDHPLLPQMRLETILD